MKSNISLLALATISLSMLQHRKWIVARATQRGFYTAYT